ncbi:hypothetical protein CEE44_05235 [Candidatus Woesearchaeota archaeon B3_Woes]|nr:MAG: hypothetical protein CEE44_05235 [Candidatus Woesearchaeota archaeon B3_Woes]
MLKKALKPGFNISEREIKDLSRAWIILSLAFAIVFQGFSLSIDFLLAWVVSLLTVGTAFIFHELGHKIVAQKYGCFAEFRSFDKMLGFALLMSFFGFVFAAPGAVMISGPVGIKRNGKISAWGPGTNIILAIIFLYINSMSIGNAVGVISYYGFVVNSWLALFNLLPFPMFDGKKILKWNKTVYGLMIFVSFVLMGLQGTLSVP